MALGWPGRRNIARARLKMSVFPVRAVAFQCRFWRAIRPLRACVSRMHAVLLLWSWETVGPNSGSLGLQHTPEPGGSSHLSIVPAIEAFVSEQHGSGRGGRDVQAVSIRQSWSIRANMTRLIGFSAPGPRRFGK